mmetsp:Transcript_17590/g.70641  ORF Transcript_17590/g.70641 Transcript_17590/m.70641 type:complete len:213 (-) Transcript_17590:583-1221(-)
MYGMIPVAVRETTSAAAASTVETAWGCCCYCCSGLRNNVRSRATLVSASRRPRCERPGRGGRVGGERRGAPRLDGGEEEAVVGGAHHGPRVGRVVAGARLFGAQLEADGEDGVAQLVPGELDRLVVAVVEVGPRAVEVGARGGNPVVEERAEVDPRAARLEEPPDGRDVVEDDGRGVDEETRQNRVPRVALVGVHLEELARSHREVDAARVL